MPCQRIFGLAVTSLFLMAACGPTTLEEAFGESGSLLIEDAKPETQVGTVASVSETYPDGTSWNCEARTYRLVENPQEFVSADPDASVIWPGNLLKGNALNDGELKPTYLRRGSGKIILNLVNSGGDTGQANDYQEPVSTVDQGSVVFAMNRLVARNVGETPAKFDLAYIKIDSREQMERAMGGKAKLLSFFEGSGRLNFKSDKRYTRYLVTLTQQYYTMVFQDPASPKDLVAPDVTPGDVSADLGDGNPLTYISSVTFGRRFYMLFESTANDEDLEFSIKVALNFIKILDADADGKLRHAKTQSQTTIKAYAVGGASDAAFDAAISAQSGAFDKLHAYIVQGANFDSHNPGLPVSFVVRYASDKTLVKVSDALEYQKRRCYPVVRPDGHLVLWLDAHKLTTNDRQYISTWPGQSVATNDGRNGRGLYFKSGVNNHPSVWFEGRTTTNTVPHRFDVDLGSAYTVNTDYTIFALIRQAGEDLPSQPFAQKQPNNFFIQGTTASGQSGLYAGWVSPDVFRWGHGGNTLDANIRPNVTGDLLVLRYSSKNGKWLYQNGLFRTAALNQTATVSNFPGASLGYAGGTFSPYVGHIGEMQVFNYALSEAEIKSVECQVAQRWGLAVASCLNGKPDLAEVNF